jgi:hypothetical protein
MLHDVHQLAGANSRLNLTQQITTAILVNAAIHNGLHDFLERHLNASCVCHARQPQSRDRFFTPPRCLVLLAVFVANPRPLQSWSAALLFVLL